MFVMFLCIIWSHNLPKKAGRIFPNLDYINKNTTVFWRWEFIFTTVKLRFSEVSLYSYCQNFFSRLRYSRLDKNNCFRFSIDKAAAATILCLYNQAGKLYQKRHPKNFFKKFFWLSPSWIISSKYNCKNPNIPSNYNCIFSKRNRFGMRIAIKIFAARFYISELENNCKFFSIAKGGPEISKNFHSVQFL